MCGCRADSRVGYRTGGRLFGRLVYKLGGGLRACLPVGLLCLCACLLSVDLLYNMCLLFVSICMMHFTQQI